MFHLARSLWKGENQQVDSRVRLGPVLGLSLVLSYPFLFDLVHGPLTIAILMSVLVAALR